MAICVMAVVAVAPYLSGGNYRRAFTQDGRRISANDCLILQIFPMDDGETREEVPVQFGISSITPGRGECVACILVLSVVLSHGARLSASWADSDDQTKCSAFDAVGEGASSVFPPWNGDTPDGERFLQRLAGRFLCLAPKTVEHSRYLLPLSNRSRPSSRVDGFWESTW